MPKASNGNSKTPRRIVCVETGEVYNAAEDAARALGIAYGGSNIRIAAGNGGMAKGYHWYFEDDEAAEPGEVRGNKAVVCWETGVVFESSDKAAAAVSVRSVNITEVIRKMRSSGGCHWYWTDEPKPDAAELKPIQKSRKSAAVGVERAGAASGDNETVEVTTSVGDAVDDVEAAEIAPHEDRTTAASSAAGYSLSELAEKGLAVRASDKVGAPVELTPAGRSCLSAYPRLAMEAVGSRLGHMAVLEKEELLVSTSSGADDRIAAFRSWLENPSETLSNAVEEDENAATYGAGDVAEESVGAAASDIDVAAEGGFGRCGYRLRCPRCRCC